MHKLFLPFLETREQLRIFGKAPIRVVPTRDLNSPNPFFHSIIKNNEAKKPLIKDFLYH